MNDVPPYGNEKQSLREEVFCRRQLRHRRETAKKKRRRNLFFAVCTGMLLILIVGILLLCKSCALKNSSEALNRGIIGSFLLSDKSCTYAFKEDGSGYLLLNGGSQYAFTYTLTGNTLKIRFINAAVADSTYTVAFRDNRLTLIAGKGTVSPGTEYKFDKIS